MSRKKIVGGLLILSIIGGAFWSLNGQEVNNVGQASEKTNTENVSIQTNTGKSNELSDPENVSEFEQSTPNVSSKKIYGTFESENSWLKDPSVPENIIFDGVTSIVNLKVISIGEAEILPKSEDFYSSTPHTPIQVEIIDIFSGEAQSGKQTIYIEGGDIKISKLIESVDKDTIAKMEFEKLSKDQKDSMYVSYNSQHDFKMKTGKEYGVILVEKIEGIYVISERGYGIFDIPKTKTVNGTNMYKNVLTGKESDIKNLKKK